MSAVRCSMMAEGKTGGTGAQDKGAEIIGNRTGKRENGFSP